MKLKLFIVPVVLSLVLFNSCLKDTPYLDVSNTAPIISFGISPANGSQGPFAFAGDTLGSVVTDTAVAIFISSPQVLNKAYNITIRIDTTQISAFNASEPDSTPYTLLPSQYYTLPDTVITIAAEHRVGQIPVKLNLPSLPNPHTYALPLTIVDGDGLIISGNSAQFMWLFKQ
jgi:hypothetical protein